MTYVDLYTRLSILQDGSDSIDRQEKELRAEAERQGKTVRKVWSDGKSGYKDVKRADFDQAISAVTSGEVEELMVWKLDRLSRQGAGKVGTILDDLTRAGTRITFLKDGLDSGNHQHRMMIILVSEQARSESTNTGIRVTAKNEDSVSLGFPVAGKRRYGYLGADRPTGRRGNTVAHPEEGPQVTQLFMDFLGGQSIRSLSKRMQWRTLRVRETLTNPAYAGHVVRRGKLYPAHESVARLVTQDTFDAAQARLSLNEAPKGGGVVKHLASGIARCGVCGKAMSYRNSYLCLADLTHPTIKGEFLETAIQEKVVATIIEPDFDVKADPAGVSIRESQVELDLLEEKIQDVLSGLSEGLTMKQLLPHLAPLQERQRAVQRRIGSLLAESVQARLLAEITASIKRHLGTYPEGQWPTPMPRETIVRWEYRKLSLDLKRELVRGLLRIEVYPGIGPERISIEKIELSP